MTKVLTFVVSRNLMRIQAFFKSIFKMKFYSATKIQRFYKKLLANRRLYSELSSKLKSILFYSNIRKL